MYNVVFEIRKHVSLVVENKNKYLNNASDF